MTACNLVKMTTEGKIPTPAVAAADRRTWSAAIF
jgi:hypothetical protein